MDERERKHRKLRDLWDGIAQRADVSAQTGCPDPEILSAYFMGVLGKEETAQYEAHFSVCSACQEALAALVKTASADETALALEHLHADRSEGTELADAAAQLSRFGQGVPALEVEIPVVAAASSAPVAMKPVAAQPEVQRESPRGSGKRVFWPWVVPALAAAAVFAVWMTMRLGQRTQQNGVESAKNVPAAPPEAGRIADEKTPGPTLPAAPVTKALGKEKGQAAGGAMSVDGAAAADSSATTALAREAAPSAGIAGAAGSDVPTAHKRAASDTTSALTPAAPPPQIQTRADDKIEAANGRRDAVKLGEPVPTKQPPQDAGTFSQTPAQTSEGKLQQEKPTVQSRGQLEAAPANAYRAKEPVGVVAGGTAQTVEVTTANPIVKDARASRVFSPGRRVAWSVGPGGAVSRSQDGGVTWTKQDAGVAVDLLSAFAPSDSVCWLVGRAGTVLLTTDGYHWSKLVSPGTQDWIGVRATDALHAVIWDLNRAHRFSTSDGGQTWQSVGQ